MTIDESLRAALDDARSVDSSALKPVESQVPAGAQVDRHGEDAATTRPELLAASIAVLEQGSSVGAHDAVIDLVGERLVSAAVAGESGAIAEVDAELADLAGAAVRGAANTSHDADRVWLAEATGAFAALRWVARLFAEQLAGPSVVAHDTHAARMLEAITKRPGLTNAEVMEALETDKTQVSRTGRALIGAGLAACSRLGKSNSWRATAKGMAAARALEATSEPAQADAEVPGLDVLLQDRLDDLLSDEYYPALREGLRQGEGAIVANVHSYGRGLTLALVDPGGSSQMAGGRSSHSDRSLPPFGFDAGNPLDTASVADALQNLVRRASTKLPGARTSPTKAAAQAAARQIAAGKVPTTTAGRRAAVKKAAARKAVVAKAAAKSTAVKKAAAKSTAMKKAAAKKVTAPEAAARKATAGRDQSAGVGKRRKK